MSTSHAVKARALLFGFLLACSPLSPAPAQGGEVRPIDESLIATLHRVGVPADEILSAIDRKGLDRELGEDAIRRLESQGVPRVVLARLNKEIADRVVPQVSVEDILAMHEAGITIPVIRSRIVASPKPIEHDAEDVLRLASAGVPAALIRAMREHRPGTVAIEKSPDGSMGIDDLVAMAKTGLSRDQMLERIRRADATFAIVIDDLITLSRNGVPQEVINEVWARRDVQPTAHESSEEPAATPGDETDSDLFPHLLIHREPAGPFSLIVPAGWHAFRDQSGRNELLSLTDEPLGDDTSLANTEIQILRVRAREGESDRLVPQNLEGIAKNFVLRLQANYASKQMSLRAGPPRRIEISGQPAVLHRLASTDAEGTTHEGELAVTFHGSRVYVISYAIRADLFAKRSELLSAALRTLTFETERAALDLEAEPRDQLRTLFEIWRAAIRNNDFGRFRQLLPEGTDTPERRLAFAKRVEQLDREELNLQLGMIQLDEASGEARVHCRVIAPKSAETVVLPFKRTQRGFRLQ